MTVPLILFILPVLFVILGPAACSISDQFINAQACASSSARGLTSLFSNRRTAPSSLSRSLRRLDLAARGQHRKISS
jgi:hypothetical protein